MKICQSIFREICLAIEGYISIVYSYPNCDFCQLLNYSHCETLGTSNQQQSLGAWCSIGAASKAKVGWWDFADAFQAWRRLEWPWVVTNQW